MSNINIEVDGDGHSALITVTATDRGQTVRVQARMDQESVRYFIRRLCDRAGLPAPWEGTR